MKVSKRIAIIGLDGATLNLIKPWSYQGQLPNLSRLMAQGCYGTLASTLQPTTAPAWVTFMTGMNQGKHGLYDFVRRRSDSYNLQVTNSSHISASTMFEVASQHGKRVITVNVPYTFPPRSIHGVMIGGPFAPAVTPALVSPTDYFSLIQKIVPEYFVLPDFDARASDPLTDYANKLIKGITMREKLSLHLLDKEPWDLFMVVFMATDEVQHTFWHCLEAEDGTPAARYRHVIRDVYRRADQAIGAMLDQINEDGSEQETVVLVVSDHGSGPFHLMINLNHWLAQEGYLAFRDDRKGPLKRTYAETLKRFVELYRRYVSASGRAAIRKHLGVNLFNQAKEGFESALLTASVAWDRTQAYSLGAGGNIYLNVRGREPLGIVKPGIEYERLCRELSDALMRMQDPQTGDALVRRVYRREEIYHGPKLDVAPDLIIEWADYGYWGRGRYDIHSPVFETQRHFDFSDQPLTGSHRPEGVLIAHGSGIRVGEQIEGARLLDMAPTVLNLLGISPPPEIDGRLLSELLSEQEFEWLRQHLEEQDHLVTNEEFEYDSQQEKQISEHLRSLGYL